MQLLPNIAGRARAHGQACARAQCERL